jgi:hypothetical protein
MPAAQQDRLLESVEAAELLVLSFPLYVDSLPSLLIEALEALASAPRRAGSRRRLAAVCNCGFPEAGHGAIALEVCHRFAMEAGFEWAGGLALGGGGVIDGKPLSGSLLDPLTWTAKAQIRGLDLAAEALAGGNPIPERAIRLLARPMAPRWLYLSIASLGWRLKARRNGASRQLFAAPYRP